MSDDPFETPSRGPDPAATPGQEPPRNCPRCRNPVPTSASEGLCPRCLLEAASAPTEAGTQAIVAGQAPSVAQVADAFPELEVVEFIGAGGMGAVYRARQPKLDRWVALKILPAPLGRDPAFAERFLREARVLARLHHPRIVTVFDFGQAGEFFYLLMEYVDGVNLRQAMRAGRFTPTQALVLVPQICEALQFAHDTGVMHRDIKPENILLDTQGRVKIADFGIAKLLNDAPRDVRLTGTGAAVGTPQYMAPEQIERPEDVDHRADVYSLGVVFYELLTGELPLGRFAPPSSKTGTDLDSRIDEIVLRALAKERELRQQTASEMRSEVEAVPKAVDSRQEAEVPRIADRTRRESVGALWTLPLGYRQALLGLGLAVLGMMVLRLTESLPMMGRVLLQGFASSWQEGVGTLAGLASVGVLGVVAWRRREDWLRPLAPPLGGPGVSESPGLNAVLQWVLIGWVLCLGLEAAQILVSQGWTIGYSCRRLGFGAWGWGIEGWMILGFLASVGCLLGLPWMALWLERSRREAVDSGPMPAWALRVAAGVVVLTALSNLAILAHRFTGPAATVVYDSTGFVLLTVVALWVGHRGYRAVGLAISGGCLGLGLIRSLALLGQIAMGSWNTSTDGMPQESPAVFWMGHPWVAVGFSTLSLLVYVACLGVLLAPSVRRAFGVVPPGSAGTRKPGATETAGAESRSGGVRPRENTPKDGVGRVLPEAWRSPLTIGLVLPAGWVATRLPPMLGLVLALSLPAMLVREWFREGPFLPRTVPGWMKRMSLSLAVLGVLIAIGLLPIHRSPGVWTLAALGPSMVIATTIVALTTQGRYWRAIALPLNGWFLVWIASGWLMGVRTAAGWFLAGAPGGVLTVGPGGFDPSLAAGSFLADAASCVAYAAGVVTLCLPSARAAFGIARRREEPRPVALATKTGSA